MKKQLIILLICTMSNSLPFGEGWGGALFAQFYSETVYTTKDGLKSNIIKDLIQSKDGHLWMINAGELCKFDGKDFTYYPLKNDIQVDWSETELTELTTGEIMLRSTEFAKFNPKRETFIYYADPPKEATTAYTDNGEIKGNIVPNGAPFDKNGNVWYATLKGVFKLFEDSCTNLLEGSNKINNPKNIYPNLDNNGKCWTGTKKSLYQLEENGVIEHDLTKFGFDTNAFKPEVKFVTANGEILFSNTFRLKNKNGLRNFVDSQTYLLKNDGELDTLKIPNIYNITSLVHRSNKFYMLNNLEPKNQLFIYDQNNKTVKSSTNVRYNYKLVLTINNNIISYKIGESNSFTIIDENDTHHYLKYKSKSTNKVISDTEKNLWIASDKGLIKYSNTQLSFKTIKHPPASLGFDFQLGMGVVDDKQNFWYSLDYDIRDDFGNPIPSQKYLCKYHPNTQITDTLLSNHTGFDLFWDNENNTMWISADDIFYHSKNGVITKTTIQDEYDIYYFKNGTCYGFNYDGGVYYLDNNEFIPISKHGLPDYKEPSNLFLSNNIYNRDGQEISLLDEKSHKIEFILKADSGEWTFRGVTDTENNHWLFSAKNQKVYYVNPNLTTKKESAYQNSGVRNYNIKTTADKSGNIWVSSNMGLNFLTIDSDTIKSDLISKKEGLSSTIINDLHVDEHNFLWVATDNGVDRLNVTTYLKNGAVELEHFGKKEGLKDVNCTKFVVRNKQLIAFTNSGFAVIDTTIKLTTLIAPNPYFTSLGYAIDEEFSALKLGPSFSEEGVSFNNPFGSVYIGYNAIKFNNTKPLQYTTLLYKEGKLLYGSFDNFNWSEQEEVKYEGLAPGNYKVEVYCRVGDKGVKSEPTILEFTILPAWWQTWWAKGLLVVFVLLVLYLLYKQRTKALLKRQKQLEQTVEEKTAEANQERDVAHEQKLIAEEKTNEILDSLNYAKRLQEAILPSQKLVKEWLTESFIFYKPKDIVAGDFYWMETASSSVSSEGGEPPFPSGRAGDGLIFFAAADCTGHGVPGAMVSVVCANALNRSVKEFGLTDPGLILDKVSELVVEAFEKSEDEIKDGMDIALCALDMSSKKLYYSGANNSLYRITQRVKGEELPLKSSYTETHKLIEYKATKRPIGSHFENKKFETEEIQLNPGDSIYLFSDGYADQFGGEKGKKLKYSSFRQLLLANHKLPMEEQKNILSTTFDNWKGSMEQIDDVCVIGVKVNGVERNNFTESELNVLACLKEGLSSKLIADKLNLSKNTIDTYRRRLLAKTGTYNATELINYCVKKEII